MTISETQLATWSNRGAVVGAAGTLNAVKVALRRSEELREYRWIAYTQGSYVNVTNIRGASDVDLVVEFTGGEETSLGDRQSLMRQRWFYATVLAELRERFGFMSVSERRKCIRIAGGGTTKRLNADVVVAFRHTDFDLRPSGIGGVRLYTGFFGNDIVNFPRLHRSRGAAKNKRTRGRFRTTVRMFKNARNHIGRKSWFPPDVPSYHLECLLHNVPDKCFVKSRQETYLRTTNWLIEQFERDPGGDNLLCQNGVHELFGSDEIHWNAREARRCVEGFATLWESGPRG